MQGHANLTPITNGHMVFKKDRVEMGNSHYFNVQHRNS